MNLTKQEKCELCKLWYIKWFSRECRLLQINLLLLLLVIVYLFTHNSMHKVRHQAGSVRDYLYGSPNSIPTHIWKSPFLYSIYMRWHGMGIAHNVKACESVANPYSSLAQSLLQVFAPVAQSSNTKLTIFWWHMSITKALGAKCWHYYKYFWHSDICSTSML